MSRKQKKVKGDGNKKKKAVTYISYLAILQKISDVSEEDLSL